MRFALIFGLVVTILLGDQIASRLADQKVRKAYIALGSVALGTPNSEILVPNAKRTCDNDTVYLFYRYQFCFLPYAKRKADNADGWHLVYHKPKPFLSIVMPARRADHFYFLESVQGEYVLFLDREGNILMGDRR